MPNYSYNVISLLGDMHYKIFGSDSWRFQRIQCLGNHTAIFVVLHPYRKTITIGLTFRQALRKLAGGCSVLHRNFAA